MSRPEDMLKELRIDRRSAAKAPRRRRWPWVAAILILLLGGLYGLRAMRPIVVETAVAVDAAQSGPTSLLDASGFVTARRIATVSSKITGRVLEVNIEEGQRVAAGDLLARLDPVDAEAQRALVRSQLASSQSQLAEAESQLHLAELSLRRQQDLIDRKLTSQSALDAAQADRDSRAARLLSLRKSVQVASDQLAVAELNVANTEVRAPFDGVIIAKAAQPGEMVSPLSAGGGFTRTGIGTLVDMDSLEVNVDVNEAYIGRVQPGMPVQAVLNAYPDWKIPGSVIAIVPTADRTKATVKVRIALDEKDSRIVPDMGVRVSFLQAADPMAAPVQGVWLPERAVVTTDEESHVFVLEGEVVRQVAVTLGDKRDAERLVSSGVSAGAQVVLTPAAKLRDGSRVSVDK
ncbi:MAG: efflux RND transporter periplasmic adaptor subunit [Xanthomonadales bacterium]|jgi:RND family efflux transporter MFP subunit|nr:efflux RND transporter periplasmic adaptor subunit [Xanthomonadales bacterium]